MEFDERWLKRPHSTINQQRNVDKELQRIKSLGVVSVLNKNFQQEVVTIAPSSIEDAGKSRTDSISQQVRRTSVIGQGFTINKSLPSSKSKPRVVPMGSIVPTTIMLEQSPTSPPLAEKEILMNEEEEKEEREDNNPLEMTESAIMMDTDKEALKKRITELEELYTGSIKKLQDLESQNKTQSHLLKLQDELIHCLSHQIEEYTQPNQDLVVSMEKVHKDIQGLSSEMNELAPLRSRYETDLIDIKEQLSSYDYTLDELEKMAERVQEESRSQALYIDTKVQTLFDKLSQKESRIQELQHSYTIHSNPSSANQSPIYSARSSYLSENENKFYRRSYISFWKGNVLPPASPPPSMPLPPIPLESYRSGSGSILSEISKASGTHLPMNMNETNSISYDEIDIQLSDEAYYKEFTNQLQEKLSISKEIDDLDVWRPSDYDYIQRKIDTNWNTSETSEHKEHHAFWKGMKKKLRV
ncbi:uncharacterized protein BX663DRAFT_506643 [Cokeromyces recurvatus]|uniref:uncharacterized protein n=1 Tax=Cokeromyces recurvatus TaxID=90255 RepID=UPI00222019A4|nr:uncharacterized protein BX663DRAFT_506643 [Cokeromyces recurvatus]KAI7903488.1 hypothetical protein BX663DRAFT_506643 [Cokeromyces recurvatus]